MQESLQVWPPLFPDFSGGDKAISTVHRSVFMLQISCKTIFGHSVQICDSDHLSQLSIPVPSAKAPETEVLQRDKHFCEYVKGENGRTAWPKAYCS